MNFIFKQSLVIFLLVFFGGMQSVCAQGILPSFGSARSGTSGFQFTKIGVDARSAAMGLSNAADAKDASSLYWNPALAAQADQSELMIGHTSYFVDISMEYLAYIHRVKSFTFGASIQYLNSGEINETTEFNQTGTGRVFRTIHMATAVTASHRITDLFSYGLTVRYLNERIEEVKVNSVGFDFGFFYQVGETGLNFAVALTNFGLDSTPSGETTRTTQDGPVTETDFEDIPLPTRFILSTAYDFDINENIGAVFTGQITNPSDNAEQFSFGGELKFMEQFFVRTGYQFGDREVKLPSFGGGVRFNVAGKSINADYGFSPFQRLGNLHRISLRLGL